MFETFEHTADVGLRIEASDLPELFVAAARGLVALLVENPGDVRPLVVRAVAIDEPDLALRRQKQKKSSKSTNDFSPSKPRTLPGRGAPI